MQKKIRSAKDYALLTAKGMAMGAADVVPGVSGGTIAFITGIYDELLGSLKNLGPSALSILIKQGFNAFWQHINGWFLVAVFGGILISLKTFAALIMVALESHPLQVWGFFSGLILASIYLLYKSNPSFRVKEWLGLLIGASLVYAISISSPGQLAGDWWILFLGGFVAICAMILPGISGSFILLLVGLYPVFLNAINDFDIVSLASFGAGCFTGLLVFSKFLHWLLAKYYSVTVAVLTGFLVGSLNVTWPWKQVIQTTVNRHGEEIPIVQQNVLPDSYIQITGNDSLFISVCIFSLLGLMLVVSTEKLAELLKK